MCMYCDVNCNSSCDCCEAFRDAIERVRKLHIKGTSMYNDNWEICIWCSSICQHETSDAVVYWPCDTIRAIDGEQ